MTVLRFHQDDRVAEVIQSVLSSPHRKHYVTVSRCATKATLDSVFSALHLQGQVSQTPIVETLGRMSTGWNTHESNCMLHCTHTFDARQVTLFKQLRGRLRAPDAVLNVVIYDHSGVREAWYARLFKKLRINLS